MIKVAHVLANLDRGGIETWLKDVVLAYDKKKFQLDFVLMNPKPGAYDEIVRKEGSKLNIISLKDGLLTFSWNLFRLFKREKYDVVHAHPHFFCGYICFIAFLAGTPCRISHSHNDTSRAEAGASPKRKCYLAVQGILIRLFSTRKIACSKEAGFALFGKSSFKLLYCAVNFDRFLKTEDESMREQLLKQFRLPADAVCIGHVGRFAKQKNHTFLIDIFKDVSKKIPNAYLLLVGEGPLQEEIKAKARRLNLKNILFLGGRDDVGVLMKNLFDIFLFPSLYEGLPVVLLEAQIAGVKCIISDVISQEVILIPGNTVRLLLDDSPQTWASALCEMLNHPSSLSYEDLVRIANHSPFSIHYSARRLEEIYAGNIKTDRFIESLNDYR
jgi:glycosyltransferase involved in cell wall biosynthesis